MSNKEELLNFIMSLTAEQADMIVSRLDKLTAALNG